ncbi:MAG: (Fe-S)-binding protein [Nitrosomonadaceae bacterium]
MITNPNSLQPDFSPASLLAKANHCVACGLCLPHCPTYRITLSEADSPRGRIALMSAAVSGRIPMNDRFALHIDRCLTCRACEAVCPNHVSYGHLVDGTRAIMAQASSSPTEHNSRKKKSLFRTLAENEFIAKPRRLDSFRPFLRLYQKSGLQALVRKSNLLRKTKFAALDAQLPLIDMPYPTPSIRTSSWNTIYPPSGQSRGDIGLFLGCVARLADVPTLNAAIFVLNRLGYTIHVPPTQTCCGALHRHSGDMQTSNLLAEVNLSAFEGLKLDAIISTASGCGAHLEESTLSSSAEIMDISAFLEKAEGWNEIKISPLPRKILVHDPCSLRNVSHSAEYPYSLLSRIPGATPVPLSGNDQCCGAAGTYFLDQPEMAKALLNDKIAAVAQSGEHILVTSNVGCSMHLAGSLRQSGSKVEVLHPVTLLARQMGMSS